MFHLEEGQSGQSVLHEAWSVFTDPAHIIAEVGFTIVMDGILLYLVYQLLFRKVLLPRLSNRIHSEIDAEHGVDHDAASTQLKDSGFRHNVRVALPVVEEVAEDAAEAAL